MPKVFIGVSKVFRFFQKEKVRISFFQNSTKSLKDHSIFLKYRISKINQNKYTYFN